MDKLNTLRTVSFALIASIALVFPLTVASVNSGDVVLDATENARFANDVDTATVDAPVSESTVVLDEVRIIVGSPAGAQARSAPCWTHDLAQGGSPDAPSVKVCGFAPGT